MLTTFIISKTITMEEYHIKLTKDSPWIIEYGYSLANVLIRLTGSDDLPYKCYVVIL
jgi:hypothetical protein